VIPCNSVVLCTGTFLSGEIHLGLRRWPAGRLSDPASPPHGLSRSLKDAGFSLGRLQTGTPARIRRDSVNFDGLERQDGDVVPDPFSFLADNVDNAGRQVPCFKTFTSAATHQLVRDNIHLSVHIQETKNGNPYSFLGGYSSLLA
jgi:tRNA uridine 5-carboxymethylaminomethyl modification enzyme